MLVDFNPTLPLSRSSASPFPNDERRTGPTRLAHPVSIYPEIRVSSSPTDPLPTLLPGTSRSLFPRRRMPRSSNKS